MRPADILALQAELGSRLEDHRFSRLFDSYFHDTVTSAGQRDISERGYAPLARGYLKVAHTYRVESHMNRLIAQHAHDFADDMTAEAYPPPTPSGFLVFEEPIALREISGLDQYMHMLAWCPMPFRQRMMGKSVPAGGTLFYAFNDLSREPDPVWKRNREIEEANPDYDVHMIDEIVGRFSMIFAFPFAQNWPMGERVIMPSKDTVSAKRYAELDISANAGADNVRRYFTALSGLLSEVLPGAGREPVELDRRARKLALRQKLTPQVDLVTLRRETTPTQFPGSGTPIGVRYHVNTFPRTYHRGTDREFTIWVRPHERGPKNAPYSMRQKVGNLRR